MAANPYSEAEAPASGGSDRAPASDAASQRAPAMERESSNPEDDELAPK